MNKIQPEVDVAPTLGWLAELESRTEHIKGKLAHEFGAGAPCNNCDRCTGLDLHFWRKACRICKCRGDQHDCTDDDLAGFMQFEILGQKRSKPCYINIKTAPEPARLDWVPPNTDAKLAAEYMNELEAENIPISGSKAAFKRKERLNYQVPIYDLDASLCHNLSENEATQLTNYVGKIRDQNVGQGVVVRVGDVKLPVIEHTKTSQRPELKGPIPSQPIPDAIKRDRILNFIMGSKAVQKAIFYPNAVQPDSQLLLMQQPLRSDFNGNDYLSNGDKQMLSNIGIDQEALHSSIINGRIYDKLFAKLDACKVNYDQCCLLQPLKELRSTFNDGVDRNFNNNVGNLATALEMENPVGVQCSTAFNIHPSAAFNANDDLSHLLDALQIDKSPIYENVPKKSETSEIGPKTVMQCKACQQPIFAGTVAVKAQRAGNDVAWHPKCFTCNKCGDLLADLVYFYHQGNIYCGRDLAEILKIPRCKACDELIFTKEYTAAEDATFHIRHFCCYHCDTPLAGKQYTPDDQTNMPLCLDCYDKYYAEKCQNCQRTINPAEEAVSFNKFHWHKPCFNCASVNCGKSLIGGRFCIKFDFPFCSSVCVQESIQQA